MTQATDLPAAFGEWQCAALRRGILIAECEGAYLLVGLSKETGLPRKFLPPMPLWHLIVYLREFKVEIDSRTIPVAALRQICRGITQRDIDEAHATIRAESLIEGARQRSRPAPARSST